MEEAERKKREEQDQKLVQKKQDEEFEAKLRSNMFQKADQERKARAEEVR